MKKLITSSLIVASLATTMAQVSGFDQQIDLANYPYLSSEVTVPVSPLKTSILFIGGVDMVQTTATYGNAAGEVVAKEWHDFIGITPDTVTGNEDQFWVSINHERIDRNDNLGDGGGMTVFKAQESDDGTVTILSQTLEDGRSGDFFNVDFVNTVGETGMNCGGITSSVDGRIWTAEEWFRTSNGSINFGTDGVRDTSKFTISTDIPGDFNGSQVEKFENFNYMVEIDPREAKAIRKQYNWGRQGFEGGVVMPDNKTVYLGVDATPAFFCKFIADVAGDFTVGKTYVYKHDAQDKWLEIDNTVLEKMLNFADEAVALEATTYNRIEWVALDVNSEKIYLTETGRDNPGGNWIDEHEAGAVQAPHHLARATDQGTHPDSSAYWDYYGRVLVFDPATEEMSVHLEAGSSDSQFDGQSSVAVSNYPEKHLSNPDGLNTMQVGDQTYLLICEDLNGVSHNRMPYGISNRTCELFLLDLSIENPTVNDLIRITSVPHGAEITGATVTPSHKTILVNSQHPSSDDRVNNYPYNHSLTLAITGFDGILNSLNEVEENQANGLVAFPNPVSREVNVQEITDLALYDSLGKRVRVAENTTSISVEGLSSGAYVLLTKEGTSVKIIIE